MGAWGFASLENDDAQDLIADFEDEGWAAITRAIGAVGQSGYVEAPVAARVIAAAEIIAASLGHGHSQLPKIEFPRRSPEASQLVPLRDSALSALSRIHGGSELHDLWDEAGQLAEWKRTLDGLALRLQMLPRRAPVAPRPRLARLVEGSCYAIPLPSGGYALGTLTQMLGGKLPFGYFFGPRSDEPPGQVALAKLRPEAALLRVKFGRTEIDNGRWPLVAVIPSWNPDEWPTPPETSGLAGEGMVWRVEYPRTAPKDRPERMAKITQEEARGLDKDVVFGALALEKVLDSQL